MPIGTHRKPPFRKPFLNARMRHTRKPDPRHKPPVKKTIVLQLHRAFAMTVFVSGR